MSSEIIEPSYTVSAFCIAENITRPVYYKLKRLGLGPREMRYGRVVRISHRARLAWQDAREKWSTSQQQIDEALSVRASLGGSAAKRRSA